ncbi:MAG: hypothetical protein EPO07_11320 [Verrucomicrobia bacterium]|nr:MAG: hypothetical protein EPO07_11320 [Verrucomicrobiota bacterium]
MNQEIRRQVWFRLLESDATSRYYGHLFAKYHNCDLWSKVFLATASSGTVAGWAIWNDAVLYPYFVLAWKLFSGSAAVLSIALPLINYPKRIEASRRLRTEFQDMMRDYELLWAKIDEPTYENKVEAEFRKLKDREAKLSTIEGNLPGTCTKLVIKCQDEVLTARNLPSTTSS